MSACCVVARAILLDYVVCVVVNFVYFTIPFSTLRSRREAKGEEHPTKSRTLPGTPLRREVVVTSLRVGLVINVLYYLRDKGSHFFGLYKYLLIWGDGRLVILGRPLAIGNWLLVIGDGILKSESFYLSCLFLYLTFLASPWIYTPNLAKYLTDNLFPSMNHRQYPRNVLVL